MIVCISINKNKYNCMLRNFFKWTKKLSNVITVSITMPGIALTNVGTTIKIISNIILFPYFLRVGLHTIFCIFQLRLIYRTEGGGRGGWTWRDSNNSNLTKRKVYLSIWKKNFKDVVIWGRIITTINCTGILKGPEKVTSSKTENVCRKYVFIFYYVLR